MRSARLLVLRGGAVGDFIVTLPALHALRRRWPDAHIEVIGYPHVARLAEWMGLANRIRSLDEAKIARYFAENAQVRDEDQIYFASFDIVINYLHDPEKILHDNLKRCGVPVLIQASPLVQDRHATDHLLQPLESLAIYPDPSAPFGSFSELLTSTSAAPWIALHPGSGGKKKCWPINEFIALARRIETETAFRPVFVTGDVEREKIPDLEQQLAPFQRMHQLSITELAAQLVTASAYVGNDAGITHLAAVLGVPTLALFGPTDPAIWGPRGRRVSIVTAPAGSMDALPINTVWTALQLLHPR
jgi:ADP-heptose:LPS heptosyltransferase